MDVQPFGVFHLGVDNYHTLGSKGPANGGQAFPVDYGLTVGVLPSEKVNLEVGIDWLEPADDPLLLNAKLGIPEGVIFTDSPAVNIGVFNVGFHAGVNDLDILDIIIGKTLPAGLGRIHLGYYAGSNTLKDSLGNIANSGLMAGYDLIIIADKLVFAADYAGGKNAVGGGGFGLYYYFTKDISLLAGPVWFNDPGINGSTKFTCQLDINIK